jgi:hypothetical protein
MKLLIFFLTAIALLSGSCAQAAGVFAEPASYFENGQKFYEIKIFLNTDGKSINALEGEMLYPQQDLNFQKITDGSSIVNFWIKDPQKSPDGKIIFSGGMPGGYEGEKGLLFSAIFSLKNDSSPGQTEISFQNFKVYLNDGRGTEKKLADFKSTLNLNETEIATVQADTKPPEVFAPYVTRDPNLAGGLWVVILSAQDKGEGIDHYEVFESVKEYKPEEIVKNNSLPWQIVKDPKAYILHDQSLGNYVYAKAVDKAGNVRVAIVIPSTAQKPWHFNYKVISVIIILSIAVLIIFLEFFFRRRKYE